MISKHTQTIAAIALLFVGSLAAFADEHRGTFCLDSQEFPIGMYSIDGPRAMAQAESLGIDYVQTYRTGGNDSREAINRDLAYLNLAQQHGRRVMFQFRGRTLAERKDGVDVMRHIILAVKDHPALGFWVFYDEPGGKHSPEQLMPFYQAAKEAAPEVSFAICHAWKKDIADYKNVADINLNDYYPVQHETFPQARLNLMTQFTSQVLSVGLPVIPINQCFNWQAIGRERKRTEYRGSPVDKMRFPNQAELRYLCFSGLAQGARGMFRSSLSARPRDWWAVDTTPASDKGRRRGIVCTRCRDAVPVASAICGLVAPCIYG